MHSTVFTLRPLPASMSPVVLWDMSSELWEEILDMWSYFSNSKLGAQHCGFNSTTPARSLGCVAVSSRTFNPALPADQISRRGEAGHGLCLLRSLLHLAAASLSLGQALLTCAQACGFSPVLPCQLLEIMSSVEAIAVGHLCCGALSVIWVVGAV